MIVKNNKINRLKNMFAPGGEIENIVLRQLQETKIEVLRQFDKTASLKAKDINRQTGKLRLSIDNLIPVIKWSGNRLIGTLIYSANQQLPKYWTIQEYGFDAGQYIWDQKFTIVRYRPQDQPSRRGDLLVLGNIRKDAVSTYPIYTIQGITHLEGMKGRMFLHAGRSYIIGEGVSKIRNWIVNNIGKVK